MRNELWPINVENLCRMEGRAKRIGSMFAACGRMYTETDLLFNCAAGSDCRGCSAYAVEPGIQACGKPGRHQRGPRNSLSRSTA